MYKTEFMRELGWRLAALPLPELKKSLEYYSEIIDDRVEDGMDEEEAVRALGDMDEIAREALRDFVPARQPEKETKAPEPAKTAPQETPRKKSAWKPVLLVLGSPVWIPLLAAAGCVVLAAYVCLWAAVLSLYVCYWTAVLTAGVCVWAAAFSVAAADVACLGSGVMGVAMACLTFPDRFLSGLFLFGCALAVFGVGLLLLPLMRVIVRASWKATVWMLPAAWKPGAAIMRGVWKLSAWPFRLRRLSGGGDVR